MIQEEVRDVHLVRFPEEHELLKKIEPDFDITWARRVSGFNTDLSLYFIKPRPHISQSFGFEQEIVFAISGFSSLEARTIQIIEQMFQQLPAKGRVDQTIAILASAANNVEVWLRNYASQNTQTRAYVGLSKEELLGSNDPWYLRNQLLKQLFSRDLFDYTLPLDNDLFFFGRQAIVAEHIDAIRRSENRGLFGLRKTGKTSVLFKIMRQCRENDIPVKYYDCKVSSIYKLTGDQLLNKISDDIEVALLLKSSKNRPHPNATERFLALAERIPLTTRLCLIFDEVEYISFLSKLAPHWDSDFVPFWQTIWSAQSQFRKFSFIVAGVNASLTETDKVGGVQNPMFGIVKSRYLTGFEENEVRALVSVFGKRMGLHFDNKAVEALYNRYGGHPLLTRMICSQLNAAVKVSNQQRPVKISSDQMNDDLRSREEEISFYCGHITSELEEFYPVEFEMLEMLAIDNIVDFNEFAEDIDLVRHLKSYGLIDLSRPFEPQFKIPVIQGYVASKWKKRNSVKSDRYIVPSHRRQASVFGRSSSILRDIRMAEKKFTSMQLPMLYGGSGPAEAEFFASASEAKTRDELVAFLNQANRSLVEPIDREGKRQAKNNYFFNDIKIAYPKVWSALNRIRSYRNSFLHLELNQLAKEQFEIYLGIDLDGKDPSALVDGWFQIQSAILNGLLVGLQAELAVYD